MNYCHNRLTLWMLALCLVLTVAISPALAKAQGSAAAPPAAKSATPTAPAAASSTAAPKTETKAGGAATSQEIAAAKASGKVWVNTESGVYHKDGRWYGKTKAGKFMTEAEAKASGYKAAHR